MRRALDWSFRMAAFAMLVGAFWRDILSEPLPGLIVLAFCMAVVCMMTPDAGPRD